MTSAPKEKGDAALLSRLGFWSCEARRIAEECKGPDEVSAVEWGQLREVIDLALERLEALPPVAEPVGEPVAWRVRQLHRTINGPITGWSYSGQEPLSSSLHRYEVQPLYASPAGAWKPDREAVARIVRNATSRTLQANVDPVRSFDIKYRLKERDEAVSEAADAILALQPAHQQEAER